MTDSEEICGYEGTNSGDPCQNAVNGENGRCYIPSHNAAADGGDPDAVENPQGAKSKLPDVREDILEAARVGASKGGCARAAGIHKSTLYDWLDEDSPRYDPEFQREFWQARWEGERRYIENPDDVDSRHAQFLLERSFGYTKEQTIEHGGDGLGDVVVSFAEDGGSED